MALSHHLDNCPWKLLFPFWSQTHLPLRPLCWKWDSHYQTQLSSHMALHLPEPPEGHGFAKREGKNREPQTI